MLSYITSLLNWFHTHYLTCSVERLMRRMLTLTRETHIKTEHNCTILTNKLKSSVSLFSVLLFVDSLIFK